MWQGESEHVFIRIVNRRIVAIPHQRLHKRERNVEHVIHAVSAFLRLQLPSAN